MPWGAQQPSPRTLPADHLRVRGVGVCRGRQPQHAAPVNLTDPPTMGPAHNATTSERVHARPSYEPPKLEVLCCRMN